MQRRLLFVAPWFLFPASTGGRIRTSQILRGMKGKAFSITLASPVTHDGERRHAADIAAVCDRFVSWPSRRRSPWRKYARLRHLPGRLPVAVATDRSSKGSLAVAQELAAGPDLLVVDFPHAAVLLPDAIGVPSVIFTHNVEAEIFRRQIAAAGNPFARCVWRDQTAKMERYERETLARFDRVIAVSERDAKQFREGYAIRDVHPVPTGVDLDYFAYHAPAEEPRVVFTGSMDWLPNIEGIEWLLREVWPSVAKAVPGASLKVIGRDPPARLVRAADGTSIRFTGFVDDVRPHVRGAAACVIPLLVGGGTRIKAYEAMAQGCPIVSTAIGMEGLPAEPLRHFLLADRPDEFAAALIRLLADRALGGRLSTAARAFVEASFSNTRVAAEFERICLGALNGAGG
jgi:glycosyltransferase involved in cell wall biosynthesis